MVVNTPCCAVLAALVSAAFATAQVPLLLPSTPAPALADMFVGRDTTVALAVDFDGDGRRDLLFANRGELPSQLLRNDGGWHFTARAWPPALQTEHRVVVAGDLDGDGDQDLVAVRHSGFSFVQLLFNDGLGNFSDGTTGRFPGPAYGSQTSLALGDIDADGDLDLMVGHTGPQQNRLYRNNGVGVFTEITSPSLPLWVDATAAVALLDVDGDQDLDLFTGNSSQPSRLALNNGAGVFTDVTATHLPAASLALQSIAAGDLDGDADLDLVLGVTPGNNVLYLNDGAGHFTDATAGRLPGWGGRDVALVDADGDLDLDLLVAADQAQPQLFANDGFGFFTNVTGSTLPAMQPSVTSLAIADFDADGRQDVVLGCATVAWAPEPRGRNVRLRGQGVGFDEVVTTTAEPWGGMVPTASLNTNSLVLVDHDHDGDLDLFIGNDQNTQDRLYDNDGNGVFTDVTAARLPVDAANTVETAAGDVDGDGFTDLVSTSYNGQSRLYRGSATGGFVEATTGRLPVATLLAIAVALGDVDGDGDLDIVLGTDGQDCLYRNNGQGFFTDATQFTLPPSNGVTRSVTLADFDGDGDRDLLTLGTLGSVPGVLRLHLNDGTGAMTLVNGIPGLLNNSGAVGVAAADFDGDGDVDICCGPVLLNNGNATFTFGSVVPLADHDSHLVVEDLDRDGDRDIVAAGLRWFDLGGGSRYLLNQGNGTFTSHLFTDRTEASRTAAVGDVDGDGDPDVLIGNKPSNWFLGVAWPGQTRLYANATRHVLPVGVPSLGATLEVRSHACAPGVAGPLLTATFASGGLAAAPIPLPPFGDVRLDPTGVIPLSAGLTDPALGHATATIAIPNLPALVGSRLHFQALVEGRTAPAVPSLQLTNATRFTITD